MAVDSLHHHHANNHNSHQHMARVKAGVARTTSSSSAASSSSVLSSSSAGGVAGKPHHAAASSASSSAGGTGGRAGAAERLGGPPVPAERLTPRHFLDKYSLPRVVRVVAEAGGTGGRPPMSGPLAQPLLLYRQYSSCKVLARSLRKDKHAAVETGPPLVIPDSYQGEFCQHRGLVPQVAPHRNLAALGPHSFSPTPLTFGCPLPRRDGGYAGRRQE